MKAFMQELDLLLVNAEHLLVPRSPGLALALLPRRYQDRSSFIPAMLLQRIDRLYPAGIIIAESQESLIDILRHKAPSVAYYKLEIGEDDVIFGSERVNMANPLFQRSDEEFLLMTEMASLSADMA